MVKPSLKSSLKQPATPKLYMTPLLEKRKDGLCPSLLLKDPTAPRDGFTRKSYRTSSVYMFQLKEREGVPRELTELQTIIECVTKAIKLAAKSGDGICRLSFKPEGCIWKMEFDSQITEEGAATYKIHVCCYASKGNECTNYMVDTILIPKMPSDPNPLAPDPPGYRQVKPNFDTIACKVRKSLVALEFPEFPEGCKDKSFKQIYQLNARVSSNDMFKNTFDCRLMNITSLRLRQTNMKTSLSGRLVTFFSSVQVPSQPSVEERIVQLVEKWPSNVSFEKICPLPMMPLFTTK